ncbi:MAG: D-tyrosyl-tRNA(Tyr) deacylase [Candidatus Azotimanducaceae bacterium]
MKALLQRVAQASVVVREDVGDSEGIRKSVVGEIGPGILVFVGIEIKDKDDSAALVQWMARKILGLRIFPDADKPMNCSVVDIAGQLLVVSQFTLAADTSRGKRPGFSTAAEPQLAEKIYQHLLDELSRTMPVETGKFGADMQVHLVNDGPVTFMLER